MSARLTPEQALAVDLLATGGLAGADFHGAEVALHILLDPEGESPNPMHKDNRWAMLARIADLLDENAALRARAEQAERDCGTLAEECQFLRNLVLAKRLPRRPRATNGAIKRGLLTAAWMALESQMKATDTSGALDRAKSPPPEKGGA